MRVWSKVGLDTNLGGRSCNQWKGITMANMNIPNNLWMTFLPMYHFDHGTYSIHNVCENNNKQDVETAH
jgi:hypothetical protein